MAEMVTKSWVKHFLERMVKTIGQTVMQLIVNNIHIWIMDSMSVNPREYFYTYSDLYYRKPALGSAEFWTHQHVCTMVRRYDGTMEGLPYFSQLSRVNLQSPSTDNNQHTL
jgi:hypothetical protein